jgi:hypothetical protein
VLDGVRRGIERMAGMREVEVENVSSEAAGEEAVSSTEPVQQKPNLDGRVLRYGLHHTVMFHLCMEQMESFDFFPCR